MLESLLQGGGLILQGARGLDAKFHLAKEGLGLGHCVQRACSNRSLIHLLVLALAGLDPG